MTVAARCNHRCCNCNDKGCDLCGRKKNPRDLIPKDVQRELARRRYEDELRRIG